MRTSQGPTLLFFAAAMVLFLFSMALLPPVELYCRLEKPAIALLIIQIAFLLIRLRPLRANEERSLKIATFVFLALGVVFNAALLLAVHRRC